MSKRKYTHIKLFEKEILAMQDAGKTKREIAEAIELRCVDVSPSSTGGVSTSGVTSGCVVGSGDGVSAKFSFSFVAGTGVVVIDSPFF